MSSGIKLKMLPQFPSNVTGRAGIDVTKQNGEFFLDLDYNDFPQIGALPSGTAYTLIFNPATGQYAQLPISLLGGSPPSPATVVPLVESGAGAVGISLKYAREDHVHPALGGGGASVLVSETPPVGAADNSLWWESDSGNLFIRYNDGNSAQWVATAGSAVAAPVVRSHLAGLTLSTAGSSATFGIAAGMAADNANAAMMPLAAAITKTTGAWAVGSGVGALDTGAIANSTWYHVHLIRRPDTGVVDVLVSLSATAPMLPASYTQSRRIGSMRTDASGNWVAFVQTGDDFYWSTPVTDYNAVQNPGTAAVLRTFTVPLGVRVKALLSVSVQNTGTAAQFANILISDPTLSDVAPSSATTTMSVYLNTAGQIVVQGGQASCWTNTASQARTRMLFSDANIFFYIGTLGWTDRRGRDA
ncbi:hypothetical protein ACM41_24290 [Bradyrhizobium sp. CCBAU 21362]|uniref:hypothetical protein n=1 Tax=Bradyrhizobium sp. CCBAU 21362 TaxID=1325082 RepID=UPI0023057CBF|nr:hypothetical protein [Bradyrhizobium sp. CCBAU 21362]MDA9539224.1 hypothetical protein [Bradyrhizobium sp. CCBAU 21362]